MRVRNRNVSSIRINPVGKLDLVNAALLHHIQIVPDRKYRGDGALVIGRTDLHFAASVSFSIDRALRHESIHRPRLKLPLAGKDVEMVGPVGTEGLDPLARSAALQVDAYRSVVEGIRQTSDYRDRACRKG